MLCPAQKIIQHCRIGYPGKGAAAALGEADSSTLSP